MSFSSRSCLLVAAVCLRLGFGIGAAGCLTNASPTTASDSVDDDGSSDAGGGGGGDTVVITGVISGLNGSVVLENNLADQLTLNSNGAFAFETPIPVGSNYSVTVLTQPAGQTCSVSQGFGIASTTDVNVLVVCALDVYGVGGTVTGLSGVVVLQNNGGDDLSITGDGEFVFTTSVAEGGAYEVTVLTQPAGQTCTASQNAGFVTSVVTTVSVNCTTNMYSVGGTISGLSGQVVLQNSGGDNLSLSGDGAFTFATPVAEGASYTVTVLTQPVGQTCTASQNTGTVTGAVTSVSVVCSTHVHTVGGMISGLSGQVVLQNNGGDSVTRSIDGAFTFATPVAEGSSYTVTVLTQPASYLCTVSNGSGVVGSADITNVNITCVQAYTVGGTVSGLPSSTSVVLRNNGADDLTVSSNGSFSFSTQLSTGENYAVTVRTNPSNRTCTVTHGSGTVTSADVNSVAIRCVSSTSVILFATTSTPNGAIGGRSGADALCHNDVGSLTCGNVHAFLTVTANDQISDMPTLYNVSTSVPIVSPNGTQLGSNWADILDGTIQTTLANAGVISGDAYIFGGSSANGTIHAPDSVDYTCEGWTSHVNNFSALRAELIDPNATNWIGTSSLPCIAQCSLLCLCY